MAAGTAPPPPPRRRVRGTRACRAGPESRGGFRRRGKSGGRRRAVCRALDDGGRSLRRSGSHCFVGEVLVELVSRATVRVEPGAKFSRAFISNLLSESDGKPGVAGHRFRLRARFSPLAA